MTTDRRHSTELGTTPAHARIVFGPHYFLEIQAQHDDRIRFILGETHHGFAADASAVGGELETIVQEIRRAHPGSVVD